MRSVFAYVCRREEAQHERRPVKTEKREGGKKGKERTKEAGDRPAIFSKNWPQPERMRGTVKYGAVLGK